MNLNHMLPAAQPKMNVMSRGRPGLFRLVLIFLSVSCFANDGQAVATSSQFNLEPLSNYAVNSLVRKLGRPVGRLDLRRSRSQTMGSCTTAVIARDLIIAPLYCIEFPGSEKLVSAILIMGFVDKDSIQKTKQYGVNIQPVEIGREDGYAILQVSGHPGDEWGTIALNDRPLGARSPLLAIHHPQGSALQISRAGCRTLSPAQSNIKMFSHSCATFPGSGGAPLFDLDSGAVVGFHHSSDAQAGVNHAISTHRILMTSKILRQLMTAKGKNKQ